jgi:hypothetical protein
MTMRTMTPRFQALLLAALAGLTVFSANAAPKAFTGIHVRYVGSSPHAVKTQEMLNKSMSAMCAKQGMTYKLNGPAEKIGSSATDEYYAPENYYFARYQEYYAALQNSICESTVTQLTKTLIYHLNPKGGGILYEYRSGGKTSGWTKRALPSLGTAGMVIEALESSAAKGGAKTVAAGKGFHGGYPCDVSQVWMPGGGLLADRCEMPLLQADEKKTAPVFPTRLKLASTQYMPATGDVVSKTIAEKVNLKSALPASLFFPPSDAFNGKAGGSTKPNATSVWCEKQEKKTGVNPCKSGGGGGDE